MTPAHPVEVAPARLPGWVERFAASHGAVSWSVDDGDWLGEAADGSWARLRGWGAPVGDFHPSGEWVGAPGPLLVLLVRRGGYAVAVTSASGQLLAHKVGTRHVQSRTAAGGWSQQRFARRRANQADALVEAVVGHAAAVLQRGVAEHGPAAAPAALVLGGDASLAEQVLDRLAVGERRGLRELPRRDLPDIADPRRAVLDEAVRRALAVRVLVHNA